MIVKQAVQVRQGLNRRKLLECLPVYGTGILGSIFFAREIHATPPGSSEYDVVEDPTRVLGRPVCDQGGYGKRSQFVTDVRKLKPGSPFSARSLTPLQNSFGIITPSALHFERCHAGVPTINPKKHKVLVHGLIKSRVFSVEDLMMFPSYSRTCFLECSGNGKARWSENPKIESVQDSHGMMSTSEWTGVKLSVLLRELGVLDKAKWLIAEGGDSSLLTRSLPIEKCMDDAFIAYAQNGEPVRPEQGFPFRLVLPGWEGNVQIKWLRRLLLSDRPYYTQQETSKYSDLLPNGKAQLFTFSMGVNSVITRPSGGMKLKNKGFHEIRGLAWSGSGSIKKVEVSVDGGLNWSKANLQQPVLSKCHTRFSFPWFWDGKPCILQSRSYDAAGVQPSLRELVEKKGRHSGYHMNAILSWKISSYGEINYASV